MPTPPVCAIMQPTVFPWLGYFSMIDQSDVFIYYDDVQLVKRSWQVRNRVKLNDAEHMLTIPVRSTGRDETRISTAIIASDGDWRRKQLSAITAAYRRAPHFDEAFTFLEAHYCLGHEQLSEFNIGFIESVCNRIGISSKRLRSSDYPNSHLSKDARLCDLCVTIGARTYLSAYGSMTYIESARPGGQFPGHGIDLYYFTYAHPAYRQLGSEFMSHLSILDLLFNHGFDDALPIIRSGNTPWLHYSELPNGTEQ